jgi:hypothetical protein
LSTDAGSDAEEGAGETDRRAENATFVGDSGTLPLETRRVLVQLLLGPSVDARRQSKLWPVLVRDEAVIRSRLHDVFLDIVIDHEQKVAFTRQVSSQELDVPILLRRASLTFLESALLLFLRQRLTQADAQDERAVVSLADMKEQLSVYERQRNQDRSRFERQVVNAIEKAKTLSLIQKIRGGDDRYEVSPTLKLLFGGEEIQALTRTYAAAAAAGPGIDDEQADDSAEDTNGVGQTEGESR